MSSQWISSSRAGKDCEISQSEKTALADSGNPALRSALLCSSRPQTPSAIGGVEGEEKIHYTVGTWPMQHRTYPIVITASCYIYIPSLIISRSQVQLLPTQSPIKALASSQTYLALTSIDVSHVFRLPPAALDHSNNRNEMLMHTLHTQFTHWATEQLVNVLVKDGRLCHIYSSFQACLCSLQGQWIT